MEGLAVGRIVHYRDIKYGAYDLAAIITQIVSEENGHVGLFVLYPDGQRHREALYSKKPLAGRWTWPEKKEVIASEIHESN
jgi:hypothetical protein